MLRSSDPAEVITATYSLVSVALKNLDSILACKLEKYLSCISGCVSMDTFSYQNQLQRPLFRNASEMKKLNAESRKSVSGNSPTINLTKLNFYGPGGSNHGHLFSGFGCTEKLRFHSGVQIGKVLVLHFRVRFLVHFVPGIFAEVRSN
jgi:hypothetical protein